MPSCSKSHSGSPATMTLYGSLGGTTLVSDPASSGATIEKGRLGLRSVVDSAIFVIAGDTNINGYFKVLLAEVTAGTTTGFAALSKNLTDFFCVATGAKDYTYTGLSMTAAQNATTNLRMTGTADSTDFGHFVTEVVAGAQK